MGPYIYIYGTLWICLREILGKPKRFGANGVGAWLLQVRGSPRVTEK